MDGWLGILVFGALFFLMMRFGCGAHMMRGHGKEAGGGPSPEGGRDPVCGMTVAAGQGYRKLHAGMSHSFCSKECLERFEAEPDRYPAARRAPSQVHA